MNRRAALLLALTLLGASPAPAPLVVGSVRDQHGLPVEGASVRVRTGSGAIVSGITGSDGTFALEVSDARSVTISCSFCRPTETAVGDDGSVVAIVARYDAIASAGPTSNDVRHVPSADAPSILALTPYVVLNRSSGLLPGVKLYDRGLSESGGLAVVDGIPSYDIVSNISPYYTLPSRYAGSVSVSPARKAYEYDGGANAGTFFTDADGGATYAGAVRGTQGSFLSPALRADAAFSDDGDSRASRIFAGTQASMRNYVGGASVAAANGYAVDAASNLDAYLTSARVFLTRTRGVDAGIDAWIDRGAYDVEGGSWNSAQAAWSDASARIYVRSHATVAPFAQLALTHSTGFWSGLSSFTADVAQTRGSVGVTSTSSTLDTIAQAGFTGARYHSGTTTDFHVDDALVSATFHPTARWSLESSLSTGYRLPTILLEYASPLLPDNSYSDRDRTLEATASYTDLSRLRLGVTALSRHTAGLNEGTTTSVGASLGWQVTPQLTLRAWALHVAPDLIARPAARFGAFPTAATPASAWLTYENKGARVDLIWRRDLIDWRPLNHVDATISAPLAHRVEWFISTDRRLHANGLDAGIRF